MNIRLQMVGCMVALLLAACVTQHVDTDAEQHQQRTATPAGARSGSVSTPEGQVQQSATRVTGNRAPTAVREQARIAAAQARHRIARADCDTLSSNSARYNCSAAADAKLEQELASAR
jgi:hypothetical protein